MNRRPTQPVPTVTELVCGTLALVALLNAAWLLACILT